MVLSVAGLLVARHVIPFQVLEESNDVVGNYLQTLGSIYAVLLAFVVFVVWTQFNEARAHVERESNELLDLYRAARGLSEPARSRVLTSAREYAQAVLASEWPVMSCGDPLAPGAGAAIIDQLWGALHGADPRSELDGPIYGEVLTRLNDVSDARSNRLTSSRTTIPLTLRLLLYIGAVSMVASMYLFTVPSFAIHAAITASLAGAISHVIYVIEDLDSCFHGRWQVSQAPFERVLAQMTAADDASALAISAGASTA
jgi:hypothetical protein